MLEMVEELMSTESYKISSIITSICLVVAFAAMLVLNVGMINTTFAAEEGGNGAPTGTPGHAKSAKEFKPSLGDSSSDNSNNNPSHNIPKSSHHSNHHHRSNSQSPSFVSQSSNSPSSSSSQDIGDKVITRDTIATSGAETTVGTMLLGCKGSVITTPSIKPACDKIISFIVDYCVGHMQDSGARESQQVCWDQDVMDGAFEYSIKYLDNPTHDMAKKWGTIDGIRFNAETG